MNHIFSQLELQTVLSYDRNVCNGSNFSISERWAINQDRALLLNDKRFYESRQSFTTKQTVAKIMQLLKKIKAQNWEPPIYIINP